MNGPADDRSPMAIAVGLASEVVGIGLELVVPGLVGLWLDSRLGTSPLLVVLGFVAGMVLAGWHLVRFVAKLSASNTRQNDKRRP